MLTILSPDTFKNIPWKNGLGHTTELAISDGGSLDDFDWRLSIASVVNDGDFSNFSGYQRNLVLIEGNGLTLDHHNGDVDKLSNLLDIACFDGGCQTHGHLTDGGIKDFNIMTKKTLLLPEVNGYIEQQTVTVELLAGNLLFAYSLTDDINVTKFDQINTSVPVGHLIKLSTVNFEPKSNQFSVTLTGQNMIIVQFNPGSK